MNAVAPGTPVRFADLVVAVLREPRRVTGFDGARWDLLVRQANGANMLGRIALRLDEAGLADAVPPGPAAHLEAVRRLVRVKHDEVRREVTQVLRALAPLQVPVVLLKGAAYVEAGLPPAAGRLFSDVDLMVPKARIDEVESALMVHGWVTTHHSAYDQRYYRQWMHELPPLVHLRRQTALDVHHAIAPLTARWPVDSAALFARVLPVPGRAGVQVLAPEDMALHSMVHLLLNDDLSHGLRDLSDIDLLLRRFTASEPGFWQRLVERASALGLRRALFHGLACTVDLLGTPVPATVLDTVAGWGPPVPVRLLTRAAYRRALRARHRSTADAWTPAALFALYVRGHWLRMPPLLLTRHLLVKALAFNTAREPGEKTPTPPGLPVR